MNDEAIHPYKIGESDFANYTRALRVTQTQVKRMRSVPAQCLGVLVYFHPTGSLTTYSYPRDPTLISIRRVYLYNRYTSRCPCGRCIDVYLFQKVALEVPVIPVLIYNKSMVRHNSQKIVRKCDTTDTLTL